MRKGQTRMQYLREQLQIQKLKQEQIQQQIERENLQQQIYLRQIAQLNRKARTRRLIQIGAIFAREFEIIEQYELDEIANFCRRMHERGLEPEHEVVSNTALPKMDK